MANKPSWVQDPNNPLRMTYTDTDGSVYESVSEAPLEDATDGIETDATPEPEAQEDAPTAAPTQSSGPSWVQDPKNPSRMTYTDTDGSVYESISETPKAVQPKAAPVQAEAPTETSIGHLGGVAARGSALGVGDISSLVSTSPLNPLAPIATALKSFGIDLGSLPNQVLGSMMDAAGVAKPETAGERYLETGARGVVGGALSGGAGLGEFGFNVAGGLTGGLSSQAAKEGGYGEGVQIAAGLVGGALGGIATAQALKRLGVPPEVYGGLSPEQQAQTVEAGFYAMVKDKVKAGATEDEIHAFAESQGRTLDNKQVADVVKARDTSRPWEVAPAYRKLKEEKAVKAATEAADKTEYRDSDAHGEAIKKNLEDAGVDPSVLEKQAFTKMKDRPAQQQQQRVQDIQNRINTLTEDWTNKPDFEVVHSIDDIADEGIRDAAKATGEDALGFLGPDGKVRIISSNIKNPAELHAVTFHEALGHYGLNQKFGDDLTRTLNDFYENGSGDFRSKVDDWMEKNPDYYKGQDNPQLLAAEEVLAEMSERGAIPAEFRDRLINQVKDAGRSVGLNLKYSDREIGTILGMSHDAVIKGFGRDVAANGFKFARAYHGTGEAFEDYDVSLAGQYNSEKGVTYFDSNPRNADTYAENSVSRGGDMENVGPLFDRLRALDTEYPDWKNMSESVSKEYDKIETRIANIIDGVGENSQNIRPVDIDVPVEDMLVVQANGGRILKDVREAAIRKAKTEGKKGVVFKNAIDTSTNELRGGGDVRPSDVFAMFDANKDTKPGFGPSKDGVRYMRRRRVSGDDLDEPTGAMMAGNINLDRISTLRDISGLVDDLAKNAPVVSKTFDDIKSEARDLGINPTKITRDTKGVGNLAAKLHAYRQVQTEALERVQQLQDRLAENYNDVDHANYLAKLSQLSAIHARVSGDTNEIGRAMASLRMMTESSQRSGQILKALSESGLPMSALADKDTFLRFMKEMNDVRAQSGDSAAATMGRQVMKPYWEDFILSGRHSLMLSGVGTQWKNFRDNLNNFGRDYFEAAVSVVGSPIRGGLRAAGLDVMPGTSKQEIAGRTYGVLRALMDTQAYKEMGRDWWSGRQTASLTSKVDLAEARIPVLSKVGDTLQFSDSLFRHFMENSNLYTVGVREAQKLGFRGKALFEQGSHLAQNPTPDMLKEASAMADINLLVSEPSPAVKYLEAAKSRKLEMTGTQRAVRFAANLMLPFLRTTENLLFAQIRRSPFAFLDGQTRKQFMAGGPQRDVAVTRAVLGTAIMAYYWNASEDDEKVVGNEKNYKKLQALEPGGYRPNSTVSKEAYTDATALNSSFPNIFGLDNATATNVATLANTYRGLVKTGASSLEAGAAAMRAGLKIIGESSFANSLQPYLDIAKAEPDREDKTAAAVGGLASQFVPALGRQINNAEIDTVKRDYTGDRGFKDRVVGRIESGIPGLADNYPIRYDAYGQEVEKGIGITGVGASAKRPTDPTVKEMIRVEKTLDKPVITMAPRNLTVEGMKTTLTGENYAFFQKTVGENLRSIMKEVISLPAYKKMTDKEKREVLREAQTQARKTAKEAVLGRLDVSDFKDVDEDK